MAKSTHLIQKECLSFHMSKKRNENKDLMPKNGPLRLTQQQFLNEYSCHSMQCPIHKKVNNKLIQSSPQSCKRLHIKLSANCKKARTLKAPTQWQQQQQQKYQRVQLY
jgi:hypothetical protein